MLKLVHPINHLENRANPVTAEAANQRHVALAGGDGTRLRYYLPWGAMEYLRDGL